MGCVTHSHPDQTALVSLHRTGHCRALWTVAGSSVTPLLLVSTSSRPSCVFVSVPHPLLHFFVRMWNEILPMPGLDSAGYCRGPPLCIFRERSCISFRLHYGKLCFQLGDLDVQFCSVKSWWLASQPAQPCQTGCGILQQLLLLAAFLRQNLVPVC